MKPDQARLSNGQEIVPCDGFEFTNNKPVVLINKHIFVLNPISQTKGKKMSKLDKLTHKCIRRLAKSGLSRDEAMIVSVKQLACFSTMYLNEEEHECFMDEFLDLLKTHFVEAEPE